MGTILAKAIVDQAAKDLLDPTNVRWSKSVLLNFLNAGQRQIVLLRPDAGVKTASIPLVTGSRQTLPTEGIRLFDITRNMGADGNTPGPAIRIIDREELDALDPNWASAAPANDIVHYVFDGRNPTIFYTYPGGTAGRTVEAVFQATPTAATINGVDGGLSDSPIALNDVYEPPLRSYVMHRAYAEDTDASDQAKADRHWNMFLQQLGLKLPLDKTFDPNRNAPPRDTERKAGGERGTAF